MENNIPLDVKAMGVIITDTKADGMLTYDAVRKGWLLSEEQRDKANDAIYVLAIEHGVVVDIFEKHEGLRKSEKDADESAGAVRYTFTPVPVTNINVRRRYIGTRYRSYGAAVIFFGFDCE